MLDIKIVRKVEIKTITEAQLKEILKEAISKQLPDDVVITSLDFSVKRKPNQTVELDVDAQFGDIAIATEPTETVKAPIELPEADDVETEEEASVDTDGVPTEDQVDFIAELEESEETDITDSEASDAETLAQLDEAIAEADAEEDGETGSVEDLFASVN